MRSTGSGFTGVRWRPRSSLHAVVQGLGSVVIHWWARQVLMSKRGIARAVADARHELRALDEASRDFEVPDEGRRHLRDHRDELQTMIDRPGADIADIRLATWRAARERSLWVP